jgi:predicted nuclease with TOPRIM domain
MGNKWDKLNEKLKDMSSKWDKLNKELDDALEEEFGLEELKQETLEEAAERISKTNSVYETAQDDFYHGFVDGAKWQQERMYSKEVDLINWLQQSLTAKKFYSTDAEDLLEQFKKK